MVMAELLKVYPKDITLMIEMPLKELEPLLDYLDRAVISYDGEAEPEFKAKVDIAEAVIKSLGMMCDSVRNYHDGT